MSKSIDATQTPEYLALLAQVNALQAKVASKQKISYKVGEKGGIVVGGFGRFPKNFFADEAKRFGVQAYGLTEEQVAKSPIGQFIATAKGLSYKE